VLALFLQKSFPNLSVAKLALDMMLARVGHDSRDPPKLSLRERCVLVELIHPAT
jgi:hypothetical protein